MKKVPEWTRLARLTSAELVLISCFRACDEPCRESILEFARVSAERLSHHRGPNVIAISRRRRHT
jgi:hypothetical protein